MSTQRPHKSWCSQSNVTMCNCRFPSGDDYIPGHHGPAPEPGACVFCGKRCYSRSPCAKRKEAAEGVAAPLEPLTVPQICIDCGHEFGVWFADNPVWNAIIPGRVGMLCPCCFISRANWRGFDTTGWKMVPMDNPLGEKSVEQEPTMFTARTFFDQYPLKLGSKMPLGQFIEEFAEAYAAAVSKNLQEELAKLKFTHEFAELHIAELEKEITALREKP